MGKPYTTFLGQNNVVNSTASSGTMKTISAEGRYYFRENMHITPTQTNVTCLKITSSNVIVDLRGYTLMGNTETGAGMIGIEVASNLSNIQIINGTISALSGTGIKINTGCNGIQLKNIQIDNCTLVGATIDTSKDIHIDGVMITRCDGSHASATDGAVGLRVATCKRVSASNSHFDGNQHSAEGDAMGVYVTGSTHCNFMNCTAIQNKAGTASGDNGYGFRLASGTNHAMLEDCMSGCNQSQDGAAYAFDINGCSGLIIKRAHAHGTMARGTDGGTDYSYGFSISNGSSSIYLESCSAMGNTGAANVYGFYMDQSNYNYFTTCEARNQTTSSVLTTTVAGFYTNLDRGNMFSDCNSFGNVGAANSSAICCGYYLTGGEKCSNVLYSKAKSNDGSTGLGHGIFLDSARACAIRANELLVNVGTANGYGVLDNEASSVSAYFENFAYGNGSSNGLVLNNFNVKLSPTDSVDSFPVQSAFLEDFRPLKEQSPYDNIEFIERAVTDNR